MENENSVLQEIAAEVLDAPDIQALLLLRTNELAEKRAAEAAAQTADADFQLAADIVQRLMADPRVGTSELDAALRKAISAARAARR